MRLLTLSLICQLGFFCSSAQAQSTKFVSNSKVNFARESSSPTAAPSISLATESILAAIGEGVVRELDRMWRAAGGGVDKQESVILLFRMGDGLVEGRPQGLTNEWKEFKFKWHPSAIAIVHTHPNSVNPQPSKGDQQVADKLSVPIFTVTARGMYVYDPFTKKVTLIHRGLDWLELSKWKSTTF